jgi:serine protease Do
MSVPCVVKHVGFMVLCACDSGAGKAADAGTRAAATHPTHVTEVPLVTMQPVSFAPIVKLADPSVVTIRTVAKSADGRSREGVGTGFIIDVDGTVLTNNHVVGTEKTVTVSLADEREFSGEVVGTDKPTDMAVVRIKAPDLKAIALGDSDSVEIGDWSLAIGNPFRLSHSVSAGIVSGKGRSQEDVPLDPSGYYNFLQTDASINPGNSGGPLLNLRGEVIGINTAIRAGGAQNIGFAIPINMVKQLLPILLRAGKITRSALGVHVVDLRDVPLEQRTALKVPGNKGALIRSVVPGSAAESAQLQSGDVVIEFEGEPIERAQRLQWLGSMAGVGKGVTMKVLRDGVPLQKRLVLKELAPPAPAAAPSATHSGALNDIR